MVTPNQNISLTTNFSHHYFHVKAGSNRQSKKLQIHSFTVYQSCFMNHTLQYSITSVAQRESTQAVSVGSFLSILHYYPRTSPLNSLVTNHHLK